MGSNLRWGMKDEGTEAQFPAKIPLPPDRGTLKPMVEIADIKDRESLQARLEETNQPREACITLAHRAVMRQLPSAPFDGFACPAGRR